MHNLRKEKSHGYQFPEKEALLDPCIAAHPLHCDALAPFYNFREPVLIGFPFFYWFQLLWVIITAIITAVVYFAGA